MPPKWQTPGTLFSIPLGDGTFSAGQVISHEPDALNSVLVILFDQRYSTAPRDPDAAMNKANALALQLTTPDLFKRKQWACFASTTPVYKPTDHPQLEQARKSGFIGVKVIGSGILISLLRAAHGLDPWDDWHDPNYLDKLLMPARSRPTAAILGKDAS